MSKSITAKDAGNVSNVRMDAEFKRFIELVGSGNKLPEHWNLIASALGVHDNTISKWKKLPEFEQARVAGINRRLQRMEESGKDDWRQWEASLKLLGVKSQEGTGTTVNVSVPIFNVATTEAKEKLEQLYAGSNRAND